MQVKGIVHWKRPLSITSANSHWTCARGSLVKGGEEIKLRPKVYDALKYMLENAGRLISKQELMDAVWPDAFVTDDSLVQCTVELRRALDDSTQQLLKTVPRRGYLFAAQVMTQGQTRSEPLPRPDFPAAVGERGSCWNRNDWEAPQPTGSAYFA